MGAGGGSVPYARPAGRDAPGAYMPSPSLGAASSAAGSTASITWTTPFDAATSASTTGSADRSRVDRSIPSDCRRATGRRTS